MLCFNFLFCFCCIARVVSSVLCVVSVWGLCEGRIFSHPFFSCLIKLCAVLRPDKKNKREKKRRETEREGEKRGREERQHFIRGRLTNHCHRHTTHLLPTRLLLSSTPRAQGSQVPSESRHRQQTKNIHISQFPRGFETTRA